MIILVCVLIYLLIEKNHDIKFRDKMIDERDKEIIKLRTERWNLKMKLLEEQTGKDLGYLKDNNENQKKDEP